MKKTRRNRRSKVSGIRHKGGMFQAARRLWNALAADAPVVSAEPPPPPPPTQRAPRRASRTEFQLKLTAHDLEKIALCKDGCYQKYPEIRKPYIDEVPPPPSINSGGSDKEARQYEKNFGPTIKTIARYHADVEARNANIKKCEDECNKPLNSS